MKYQIDQSQLKMAYYCGSFGFFSQLFGTRYLLDSRQSWLF